MDAIVNQRIKQVLKGDHEAFGEIVELFKDKIFHLCYRMLGIDMRPKIWHKKHLYEPM